MPLYKEEAKINPPKDIVPDIHSPAYRSVEENLTYKDRSRIINYIRGYPEIVTWYGNILGKDDQTTGNSSATHRANQQLTKISNFEIKVESPLSGEQNDKMDWDMELTANIYPCVIPNNGDQFIASIGDGRLGIFQVNGKPRPLSHMKNSVHEVTVKLLEYADEGNVKALEEKVIRRLFFRKEWMDYGQSPLIEEHDHSWARNFEEWHHNTLDQYFYQFASDEAQSFVAPGQEQITYDPFLADAMLGWFGGQFRQQYPSLGLLHVEGDEYSFTKSFWELLRRNEPALIHRIWKKSGLRDKRDIRWSLFFQNARFSPLKYIVTPIDTVQSVNAEWYKTKGGVAAKLIPSTDAILPVPLDINGLIEIPDQEGANMTEGTDGTPGEDGEPTEPVEPPKQARALIKPVTVDDYYVLSQSFYEDSEGQSLLEVLTWRFIRREGVDVPSMKLLVADYPNWGSLERFYYAPILLTLVNSAIRSL